MWRTLVGSAVLLFSVSAQAEENVQLKPGAGLQTVEANCTACHSLDYPRINAFGAPIKPPDAKVIVDYLTENYGTGGWGFPGASWMDLQKQASARNTSCARSQ
jgi:mono/diheme cytochrome c family protein